MADVNLAQPQYGDISKIQQFSKLVGKSRGTYGQPTIPQGPGRPAKPPQGGVGTKVSQTKQAQQAMQPIDPGQPVGPEAEPVIGIPHQHYNLMLAEAQAKATLLKWRARAQSPGAGPNTQTFYRQAQQNYVQAARAARYGTPFHPGM